MNYNIDIAINLRVLKCIDLFDPGEIEADMHDERISFYGSICFLQQSESNEKPLIQSVLKSRLESFGNTIEKTLWSVMYSRYRAQKNNRTKLVFKRKLKI